MSSEDRKGNVGGNKTSDEPPTSPWTPEVIKDFIEQLKPLTDSYLQLKQNSLDAQIKKINTIGLHNRRLVYWLVGFLLGVIAFMSVLTFCALQTLCNGGCPANALRSTGSLFKKDPYCGYWCPVIHHILSSVAKNPKIIGLAPNEGVSIIKND